ncbi:hypothetical protein [Streptomyces showdoensis]|uniref:hypothetical protein n=1 Tax=Streptomyces showdoensis TaxID=68268 RepID=UPI0031E4E779
MSQPSPTTPPPAQAVTTAHLAPAPAEPLLDTVSIAVLVPGRDGPLPRWTLVSAHRRSAAPSKSMPTAGPWRSASRCRLGDAAGYWHPKGGWRRTLVADWEGLARVSLVDGAAAGCLYEHSGATLLAFAAADPVPEATVRFGVSEENDTHVVHLVCPPPPPRTGCSSCRGRPPSPPPCARCAPGSPPTARRCPCRTPPGCPCTPPGTPSTRTSPQAPSRPRPGSPPGSAAGC